MLLDRLIALIDEDGPLPFEVFMEACLYDPESGFFTTGPLRSAKGGDFLTSPEVSPWFGMTLARTIDDVHRRLGDPFDVVEVGAGSGSLMRSMRNGLAGGASTFWAADASPAAQRELEEVVGAEHVVARIDEIPGSMRGVVVANELLDNQPVALAIKTDDGWEERWVGAAGGALCLVAAPVRPEVAAWADAYAGRVPVSGMVEVQLAAFDWLQSVSGRITDGLLLVIDYGGTAEELEPRRTRGTLRTYRGHHLGPDPLTAPGETDVTVDVNFTAALAAVGVPARLWRQDDFLAHWGLRDVIGDLRRRELAAAREGEVMGRYALRSERTDAETLLHPRGLGDFRVLEAGFGSIVLDSGTVATPGSVESA